MTRILSVASECAPLVKTGGLADVVGALPGALAALGDEMRTLLPGYPGVMVRLDGAREVMAFDDLFGGPARLRAARVAGLDLLVLDAPHLYDRAGGPYLAANGHDWPDNPERFAALCFAAAQIATEGVAGWHPEVVHGHDWQAGLVPEYLVRLGAGRPCRLIATSLIEAGVDLDFPCGWRAEAGLDSVIQAAGRVNREGRRPIGASTLTVFTAPEAPPPREVASLAGAMWSTLSRFDDPLHPEAIRDWFDEVYWRRDARRLGAAMVSDLAFDGSGTRFPFRTLAEAYRMIDTAMLPVIVPRDAAPSLVEALGHRWERSGALARKLQPYTVQIPERARALLHRNGKGSFHAPDLRGDQFFVLEDPSLYDMSFGLWWERADYLSADQSIV